MGTRPPCHPYISSHDGSAPTAATAISRQYFSRQFRANHQQGAILKNHGLLTVGHTVDEAGFLFGLLDRGCRIQLDVEAASAGNPSLKRHIIPDAEAEYNFRMASEKHVLYREAQPDLEYIFETEGWEKVSRGVENMVIDKVDEMGNMEAEEEQDGIGSDLAVEDFMFDELGFEVE